jgi:hypothetical protein
MADTDQDCGLTRVQKNGKITLFAKNVRVEQNIWKVDKNGLRKQFETFWLDKVNSTKIELA